MAQFTVYRNLNQASRDSYPYFVDVQNDLLDALSSRVVIPLARKERLGGRIMDNLSAELEIEGEILVLLTHQITTVPLSALKDPVCQANRWRGDILLAIDFLITGI